MSKGNWHGGKGSKRRPGNSTKFAENWDKIFSKKSKKDVDLKSHLGDNGIHNEDKRSENVKIKKK